MNRHAVYIVDDDLLSIEVLSQMLLKSGFTTKKFHSGTEFLDDPNIEDAACIVMDNQLPGMSGIEVQAELLRRNSNVPVIFVSGESDYSDVVEAVRKGALNFLQKPVAPETLVENIERAILVGKERKLKEEQRQNWKQLFGALTAREREIYLLIVSGHTNKMISDALSISVSTVEFHRANLRTKLGANSLAELMALARENDLN